jgi:hypothetical protein
MPYHTIIAKHYGIVNSYLRRKSTEKTTCEMQGLRIADTSAPAFLSMVNPHHEIPIWKHAQEHRAPFSEHKPE